jgi:hypothetical protein
MLDFPVDEIAKRVFNRFEQNVRNIFTTASPSVRLLNQLLWLIGTNAPSAGSARQWLRGERVPSQALRTMRIADRPLDVPAAPRTAQDCQNVLDGLITIALTKDGIQQQRFVLLIDEFQRAGELDEKKLKEVCDSLHLVYNRHPEGLRLVLTFASGSPAAVASSMTRDLKSRVISVIGLPAMLRQEASDYVRDLIRTNAQEPERIVAWHPFSADSAGIVLKYAYEVSRRPSLRIVNIVFDRVMVRAMSTYDGPAESTCPFDVRMVEQALVAENESLRALIAEADANP